MAMAVAVMVMVLLMMMTVMMMMKKMMTTTSMGAYDGHWDVHFRNEASRSHPPE